MNFLKVELFIHNHKVMAFLNFRRESDNTVTIQYASSEKLGQTIWNIHGIQYYYDRIESV